MFRILFLSCIAASISVSSFAAEIEEYEVKRTVDPIVIDGILDESSWSCASVTKAFRNYRDGSSTVYIGQGQMLWDDENLYVAMTLNDVDIRATYTEHDSKLYLEEVAEIFVDPDGDGLNYIEIEISPIGTLMDLLMSKEYRAGGSADWDWNLEGLTAGVTVDGTVNMGSDTDTCWVVECAIPFDSIAFSAPTMQFPPVSGDQWRLNLYRYNYDYDYTVGDELSGWNPTDSRGFHAPNLFGNVTFLNEPVGTVNVEDEPKAEDFTISGAFPNPFNPMTTIEYRLPETSVSKLSIYNISGQRVRTFPAVTQSAGRHSIVWNGCGDRGEVLSAGVYIANLETAFGTSSYRLLLMK